MKKTMLKAAIALFFVAISATTFAQDAKLITYRKAGFLYGAFAKYKVNVDGKEVGELKPGSVVTTNISAGSHTLSPKQENRAITFNAEAGKTYVVKYRNMLGLFGVRPKLKEVTLEEAKADYKKI